MLGHAYVYTVEIHITTSRREANIRSEKGFSVPNIWHIIVWNNDGLVYCRIHASLVLDVLTPSDSFMRQ